MTTQTGPKAPTETPDAIHIVRRTPADDGDPTFVSWERAIHYLVGYGHTKDDAERVLRGGSPLRTPFAYYQLVEPLPKGAVLP